MLNIYIENSASRCVYPFGISLQEVAEKEGVKLPYPIIGALVNNKVREMSYRLCKPAHVHFFDMTSLYGIEMYNRSAYFILFKAVREILPDVNLKILHSISDGKYCELENYSHLINQEFVEKIEHKMWEIVKNDLPFIREEVPTEVALEEFRKHNLKTKIDLIASRKKIYTSIYRLKDCVNYYYGVLVPSTGIINCFKLEQYESGLLLKLPSRRNPDTLSSTYRLPKLFSVYSTHKKWVEKIGVPYVIDINKKVENNEIEEFIRISEAFHEKLIANLADEIHQNEKVKLILLSGPSSSGKTTTCRRLSVQLGILGYKPLQISVDDFFVEREETPIDANGNYNFETIDAVDLPLFNKTLNRLIEGETVELPVFNFTTGKKEWRGKRIQMEPNSILVIEGIHCLNPKLTAQIDDSIKFKIFVSALTTISIDSQNPISTTDNRLIRRIIRDYRYRGYSALDTLRRWQSVRDGEREYIFPFQENADALFNTSLICELGVLKQYAVPILREVPENEPEFAEAVRLLKFLSFFKIIPEKVVPGGSILREFMGGSTFKY